MNIELQYEIYLNHTSVVGTGTTERNSHGDYTTNQNHDFDDNNMDLC